LDLGIATPGVDGPFEVEFLEVDGLSWDPKSMASLAGPPLYCDTDGCSLILRDNKLRLKELDAKEKAEVQQVGKLGRRPGATWRRVVLPAWSHPTA